MNIQNEILRIKQDGESLQIERIIPSGKRSIELIFDNILYQRLNFKKSEVILFKYFKQIFRDKRSLQSAEQPNRVKIDFSEIQLLGISSKTTIICGIKSLQKRRIVFKTNRRNVYEVNNLYFEPFSAISYTEHYI